jgi:hypothetical protein
VLSCVPAIGTVLPLEYSRQTCSETIVSEDGEEEEEDDDDDDDEFSSVN